MEGRNGTPAGFGRKREDWGEVQGAHIFLSLSANYNVQGYADFDQKHRVP